MKTLTFEKAALIIKVIMAGFFILEGIDLYLHGIRSMDDIPLAFASVLLMLYSLFAFFDLMRSLTHSNILNVPVFWFNSGVLIYFSGCLFLFVFSSYLMNNSLKTHLQLWGCINSLLNITFNLLITTGFWKTRRTQRS